MIPALIIALAVVGFAAFSSGQKSGSRGHPQIPPPQPDKPPPAPPPTSPGGVPPPTTPANILERKRLIIVRGFNRAMKKRIARLAKAGKTEPRQTTINMVARQMHKLGIPLRKPNPANPFFAQSEQTIANKVATAVSRVK